MQLQRKPDFGATCGLAVARQSAVVSGCALRVIAGCYRDYEGKQYAYLSDGCLLYAAREMLLKVAAKTMDALPSALPVPATMLVRAAGDAQASWMLSHERCGSAVTWLMRSERASHTASALVRLEDEAECAALRERLAAAEAGVERASCVAQVAVELMNDVAQSVRGDASRCRMEMTPRGLYVYTRRNSRAKVGRRVGFSGKSNLYVSTAREALLIALSYMCEAEIFVSLSPRHVALSDSRVAIFLHAESLRPLDKCDLHDTMKAWT